MLARASDFAVALNQIQIALLEIAISKYDSEEFTILLEATWQAKKQRNPQLNLRQHSRITQ
jgi:hypothetical protein